MKINDNKTFNSLTIMLRHDKKMFSRVVYKYFTGRYIATSDSIEEIPRELAKKLWDIFEEKKFKFNNDALLSSI